MLQLVSFIFFENVLQSLFINFHLAKKPVRVPKTQLFKVLSNSLLKQNLTIKIYPKEPFFEDK
jgi:hypothetical protein